LSTPISTPKRSPWPWIIGLGCGLPILGFVGCSIISVAIVANNPDVKKEIAKAQQESVQKSESGTTVKSEAINISAKALYEAYEANEIAADEKYKGKQVRVSGVVDSIGKDILDTQYVVLKGDGVMFGVQCMIGDEHKEILAKLSKGQKMVFQGEVVGKSIGNITISDAVPQP
jgi:tRNA_anti-like